MLGGESGDEDTSSKIQALVSGLSPGQVAVGIPSLIQYNVDDIRLLLTGNA
jgi:hypothetical protein